MDYRNLQVYLWTEEMPKSTNGLRKFSPDDDNPPSGSERFNDRVGTISGITYNAGIPKAVDQQIESRSRSTAPPADQPDRKDTVLVMQLPDQANSNRASTTIGRFGRRRRNERWAANSLYTMIRNPHKIERPDARTTSSTIHQSLPTNCDIVSTQSANDDDYSTGNEFATTNRSPSWGEER